MNSANAIPVAGTESASSQTSKPPIPSGVAITLLQRLSSDDPFRELFMSNPRMALCEVGYDLPPNAATPMCMMVDELASKEEISNAYDSLYLHLTGGSRASMLVPHFFAAGHTIKAANSPE
ncbi:NHLP-related RiPP peptide [Stenotrophomonas bentonitica]